MLAPLKNRAHRHLLAAQVCALLGTGLTTLALGLLAHDLAGAQAGEILGAALAIKMICYVGVAPVASALAASLPRKTLLVGLDLVRAGVAVSFPFVSEAWHVYGLMAVLYVASAAFTPAFQAMIPDVLSDEADYTKALSLSRLAADLESVASPVLAAVLLAFLSYSDLFAGTALGFAISAALVVGAGLPRLQPLNQRSFVTDANGCTATANATVDALVTVLAAAGSDQIVCAGGAIVLDGSASTGSGTVTWTDAQNNVVGGTLITTLNGLPPGAYVFTLTLTDGLCTSQDQVAVTVLDLPIADAGADVPS